MGWGLRVGRALQERFLTQAEGAGLTVCEHVEDMVARV